MRVSQIWVVNSCTVCVLRKQGLWWLIAQYSIQHMWSPQTPDRRHYWDPSLHPVQVNQYYLERCFSRQTLIHEEDWVPITAHTKYYLHVNPAVEGFVYNPSIWPGRGGAKYYSRTLPSLKTDPGFLSLLIFTSFLPPSSRNWIGRDIHRKWEVQLWKIRSRLIL